MNNTFSRSQQRREAARKYAVQCMNARGEVECSECNAGVEEARGNRNAQELDREEIRKSSKGPICNACQASWRYSHHQEPEMANAKDDNGPSDADVHAMAQKMFKDSWDNLSSKQQDQVYEALEKEMKNADNKIMVHCDVCDKTFYESPDGDGLCPDCKKKARSNAASHTDTCDFCGKDYQCNRIKHDVLKCPDCGGPSTMIKNATNIDPRYRTACPKGQGGEGCDWVESKETDDAYWFKCQRCGRVVIVSKG